MERYYDNRYVGGTEALNLDLFVNKSDKDEAYYARRRQDIDRRIKEKSLTKQRRSEKVKNAVATAVRAGDRAKVIRGVVCVIAALTIITTLVVSSAQNYDLLVEINKTEETLMSLEHEYEALMLEFDTKMSNAAVEEYASTVLGMQKRENSQTEWIDLGTGDVFEYTAGRNVLVQLRDWLAGLGA